MIQKWSSIRKFNLTYLFFLVLLYGVMSLVSQKYYSLSFFIFIPISLLSGIGFVTFFRDIFQVRNIITYVLLNLFIGVFVNTYIIFFLGTFGVTLDSRFYSVYLVVIIIFNILLFLLNCREEDIQDILNHTRFKIVDFVWFLILLVFSLVFIKICLENYFPNWDSFTHWAIDTKVIFEGEAFRDESYDLIKFGYLPFYSLQLSYVYWIYRAVVEQYSSLLTLSYALIGVFFCFSSVLSIKGSYIKKTLLYLFAFSSFFSFSLIQGLVFSQYSDVFTSVLVLLSAMVLFGRKPKEQNYWKRILLYFLLAYGIFLTKSAYLVITVFLLAFLILYDLRFIMDNYRKLIRSHKNLFVVLLIICCVYWIASYSSAFQGDQTVYSTAIQQLRSFDFNNIVYVVNMIEFIVKKLLLFSFVFSILLFWCLFVNRKTSRRDFLKISFVLLLALIPMFYWFLGNRGLEDMSILRYISLIFFASPYIFSEISSPRQIVGKYKRYLLIWITFLVPVSLFLRVTVDLELSLTFSPHTGQYKDFIWQKSFYSLATRVKEAVPEGSRIMLVKEQESNLLGNMDLPSIILRYYLSDESVGHQYRYQVEQWYEYMKKFAPDYILVSSYTDYWLGCNTILEEGNSYLISTENFEETYSEDVCFFEVENILEF